MRNTFVFGLGFAVALLAGWVAFPRGLYVRQNQPLVFRHKTHAEKSGIAECGQCHVLRADGTFAGTPTLETCTACHSERMGTSAGEAILVDNYVKTGRDVPWLVYARQPANVWFSHAIHVQKAGLACAACHSTYGESDEVRIYEQNRISGYSRDIWGHSISRIRFGRHDGMKMADCEGCHRQHHVQAECLSCHQ
ncbi:MAG: menaquinone reductase multiheme cytochrome c subunit QrcA [Candidatus Sulfotelmatobacter sp.]